MLNKTVRKKFFPRSILPSFFFFPCGVDFCNTVTRFKLRLVSYEAENLVYSLQRYHLDDKCGILSSTRIHFSWDTQIRPHTDIHNRFLEEE